MNERIQLVNEQIEQACARSGRHQEDVHLIAVTKYVSVERTQEVINHGLLHIGENRWQDARLKWEHVGHQGIWHFIGHLQTNKVREIIGKFAYVHSLDRLSLAKELDKRAGAMDLQIQAFVQVNVSGEATKYGCSPEEVKPFLKQIAGFTNISVIGLMTMAPYEEEPERTRPVFRALRELKDELNQDAILPNALTELSMGMSNDFTIAIEEGATWVRLGQVLVGKQ